jgi:hypothetical protein
MTCSTPSGQPWSPGQHRVAPIWRRGCVCSHESAARREAGPSCNPFRSWTTPTSAWPGTSTQRALRPRSASEASRHALTSERAAFTTQRWSGGCRGRRSGFSFGSGVIESESSGSTPGAAMQQRPGLSPHDGVKQLLLDARSADRLGYAMVIVAWRFWVPRPWAVRLVAVHCVAPLPTTRTSLGRRL